MWWKILFCGLIATIVTSYKVFDQNEAPIDLSEFPGEYKRKYSGGYPKCKNIKANPGNFVISSPTETYIYTCTNPEKNPMTCLCKVPIKRKRLRYDVSNCKQYEPHPNGHCNEFTVCGGTNMQLILLCGAGTMFNPTKNACDHPDNVECPIAKRNPLEPPCPYLMVRVGRFPDVKSKCKSYFECQFGVIKKKYCEDGFLFDTWTHRCTLANTSFCGCCFIGATAC